METLATAPASALAPGDAPVSLLRADGSVDPARPTELSNELAVALLEHMLLCRTLDERLVALQREGVVSQHSSAIGEEATIVGAVAAMLDEDWVFPSSREFGAALWRGMPLVAYAHHVRGSARDAAHGRNAPDPPFWKAARIASVSPLAGNHVPHAVGAAWAARAHGHDVAALLFFGGRATSTAEFHTGLNFAGVARAPVVAVCRAGSPTAATPPSRQTASCSLAIKALAYGLAGVRVDGADVAAVVHVVREARARAAAGQGATLIEAVLESRGDGTMATDPIERLRRHLEVRGIWDAAHEQRLSSEVRADVERALAEAASAGPPDRTTLFTDVLAVSPEGADPLANARESTSMKANANEGDRS